MHVSQSFARPCVLLLTRLLPHVNLAIAFELKDDFDASHCTTPPSYPFGP